MVTDHLTFDSFDGQLLERSACCMWTVHFNLEEIKRVIVFWTHDVPAGVYQLSLLMMSATKLWKCVSEPYIGSSNIWLQGLK